MGEAAGIEPASKVSRKERRRATSVATARFSAESVAFHFTPTSASWLNMIEAWFGILTRKSVRRGSFMSMKGLVRHIQNYIEHWNDNPTPFVWTKTPAAIIRKAARRSR